MKAIDDYVLKLKPFTYSVGEAKDGGTLRGIASLCTAIKDVGKNLLRPIGCRDRPERAFLRNVARHSAVTPAGTETGDEVLRPIRGGCHQHAHGEVAMDVDAQ